MTFDRWRIAATATAVSLVAAVGAPAGAVGEAQPAVVERSAADATRAVAAGMTRVTIEADDHDDLPPGSIAYRSDLLERLGRMVVDVPVAAVTAGGLETRRLVRAGVASRIVPGELGQGHNVNLDAGTGIDAPSAWWRATGDGSAVVAVVDTGVSVPFDLRGRVLAGYDTIHERATQRDEHGHGTFVAGQIAAKADNGYGIAGTCWDCRILPVRALDHNGVGWAHDIAEAIVWAVDHGADVINLSLGLVGGSIEVQRAVNHAERAGVFVVAAAGNDGVTTPTYPAAYLPVVAVAATAPGAPRQLASYSNRSGDWVDVAAPGAARSYVEDGTMVDAQGTSMAAPLVSGVAALALTLDPTLTPRDLRDSLRASAASFPLDQGPAVRSGALDARSWLDAAVPTVVVPAQRPALRYDDARALPAVKTVVRVLGNDRAPGGHDLLTSSLAPVGDPSTGTVIAKDGALVYTAPERGVLDGRARYRICTVQGGCAIGTVRINPLTLTPRPALQPLPAGAQALVGDWDGDGVDTPGYFRNGWWHQRTQLGHGTFDRSFRFGRSGDRPVVGDWNGDGVDTVGVVRGNAWILTDHHTGRGLIRSFRMGAATDEPVAGDWDGDGYTEPGLRRGNRYLIAAQTGGPVIRTIRHGNARDVAVVGDFDGDGRDRPQVYEADRVRWVLSDAPARALEWQHASAGTPLIGDWDADGRDDVGFVTSGQWSLRLTPTAGAPDVRLHLTH